MRTAKVGGVVALALLGLLLASGTSLAAEMACFTVTSEFNGTVNVDASASTPQNTIQSYRWYWYTPHHLSIFSYGVTSSHTYPAPGLYEYTVQLTVTYSNADYIVVSCETFPWNTPYDPQPPPSFTCCSSAWCNPDGQCSG
jgi:PKD repeat protein